MIIVSVLIYILTFIGFKTEIKSLLPILCFNNYILLHHGLFVNGVLKFALVLMTGLIILLFSTGQRVVKSVLVCKFLGYDFVMGHPA